MMLPASVKTKIGRSNVEVTIDTEYPFRHSARYTVTTDTPVSFTLKIRVPSFVRGVKVNGETVRKSAYICINKTWCGTETVDVELQADAKLINRPYSLKCAKWGNLVFSLPIRARWEMREYEASGVERKFPYCDYYLHTESEWSYGFANDEVKLEFKDGDGYPFSTENPRVILKASLAKINWGYEDGYSDVANHIPKSRTALSDGEEFTLIPYGAAKLRMTEMPIVKHK
jgi:hypothetical protein